MGGSPVVNKSNCLITRQKVWKKTHVFAHEHGHSDFKKGKKKREKGSNERKEKGKNLVSSRYDTL